MSDKDDRVVTSRKFILDMNEENLNIVNKKRIEEQVLPVFKRIADILLDHCGPGAEYSVLSDPFSIKDPIFTTDGINIVKSIEPINPVTDTAKKIIQYIGESVDQRSFDGTTTSMILATKMILGLYKCESVKTTPPVQLRKAFDEFVDVVSTVIDENKITVERLIEMYPDKTKDEIIYHLAYSQAYTSSHGNSQIATVVAETFVGNQHKEYDTIVVERATIETTDPVKTYTSDTDFQCGGATVLDYRMNNKRLKTEFEQNDVGLMVYNDNVTDNSALATKMMAEVMVACEVGEKPLVIIIPGLSGNITHKIISTIEKHNAFNKVTVILQQPALRSTNVNELEILKTMIPSKSTIVGEFSCAIGVNVNLVNQKLTIENIFERKSDGTHPCLNNPEYPFYNSLVEELELMIDEAQKDTSPGNIDHANTIKKIYNRLVYPVTTTIQIGGARHDMLSMIDVIQDVVGATKKSLVAGCVPGGTIGLSAALNSVEDSLIKDDKYFQLKTDFTIAIRTAIEEIQSKIMGCPIDDTNTFNLCYDAIEDKKLCIGDAPLVKDNPFIIQPADIDKDLLRRFSQICLKVLKTSRFIIRGGFIEKEE
ncbi:MAG: hypothetical protein GY804_08605 [Alphaproteobacteria bacterium]|nr:hypothetical protein [Alphaproteobacteria bacterium]